ncbi:hypothetical protein G7046_g8253 [Stylonectria norvegica]|nr:hypothetical protein G7046_g8253 [Stylonectria norvegica]
MAPPALEIYPPLLNSATPWATNLENLDAIFTSPSTGAVTTRTSLINGFDHQQDRHQYLFFNPATNTPDHGSSSSPDLPLGHTAAATASLNTLGYSPIPLDGYLDFIKRLASSHQKLRKTFIVSVTGTPDDIQACYARIEAVANDLPFPLAMEINLSCPNITGASPPAYDGAVLSKYLDGLPLSPNLAIGIKTPPYTYHGQYATLIETLRPAASSISFITSTNTLGSCLVMEDGADGTLKPQLPYSGIGGMAGSVIHPLSLGNVATIRTMLDAVPELRHVQIIGVGGVRDGQGYRRMRAAGAYAVGIGTAVGKQGPVVFERIEKDVEGKW